MIQCSRKGESYSNLLASLHSAHSAPGRGLPTKVARTPMLIVAASDRAGPPFGDLKPQALRWQS